jgi:hypothetical protein
MARRPHSLLLPALLALAASAPAPGGERQSPLENGDVRSVELLGGPDARVETFRLSLPGGDPRDPVGIARFSTGAAPGGGLRIELDAQFFDVDVRVLHVEVLRPSEVKLVWREIRARGGRTVLLEWSREDPVLRFTDLAGGENLRRELDGSRGALMPLFAIQQARGGAALEGPLVVFDPPAGRLASMQFTTTEEDGRRVVRTRHLSGATGASFEFDGDELVAFSWQAGGPRAEAISQETYETLLLNHRRRQAGH